MRIRLTIFGLLLAGLVAHGQTNGQVFQRIPISQFPLASTVTSNSLFIVANPGVNNNSILAAPLANGLFVLQSNYAAISNSIFNNLPTNSTAIQAGYFMPIVINNVISNNYWEDFGRTNSSGQSLIDASLNATNDVVFCGVTNCNRNWQKLSYIVNASVSPYSRIYIPTNTLAHFVTNYGPWIWYPSNNVRCLYLTNGFALRMAIDTNGLFLERQWNVK